MVIVHYYVAVVAYNIDVDADADADANADGEVLNSVILDCIRFSF